MSALAPQLGGKQTSGEQAENDANDPKETVLQFAAVRAAEARYDRF
jgi:hypothetical protein